jgi:hypothetical protein
MLSASIIFLINILRGGGTSSERRANILGGGWSGGGGKSCICHHLEFWRRMYVEKTGRNVKILIRTIKINL